MLEFIRFKLIGSNFIINLARQGFLQPQRLNPQRSLRIDRGEWLNRLFRKIDRKYNLLTSLRGLTLTA
jgi:hypothetical protein